MNLLNVYVRRLLEAMVIQLRLARISLLPLAVSKHSNHKCVKFCPCALLDNV
jgi:hypothetical protein